MKPKRLREMKRAWILRGNLGIEVVGGRKREFARKRGVGNNGTDYKDILHTSHLSLPSLS